MKLYDADYTKLSSEDEAKYRSLQQTELVGKFGQFEIRRSRFREYPKAVRHFIHLFPNNYLDIIELQDELPLNMLLESFQDLISSENVKERQILNFIVEKQAYFIVASILNKYFNFGHHEAYLFPEFQMGNSYQVDYLIIGKSSDGWHFVFVELEAVLGGITLSDGDLGSTFRKGMKQVFEWDTWLESRYASFSESLDKVKQLNSQLPQEFTQLDKSRIHYVIVAGRRNDFNDKTYRIRRKKQKDSSELLLHYDNLVDAAKNIIGKSSY